MLIQYAWQIDEFGPNWKSIKIYSDDELRLLFTLDPCGLMSYVNEYASIWKGSETTDIQTIQYKDYVFNVLFGREPNYYKISDDGKSWHLTTDKYNLSKVLSESEYLFGAHTVTGDSPSLEEILLRIVSCAASICSAIITPHNIVLGKFASIISGAAEVCLHVFYNDDIFTHEDLLQHIVNKSEEDIPAGNKYGPTCSWVSSLLSLCDTLNSVPSVTSQNPEVYYNALNYFRDSVDGQKSNYLVKFKFRNGQICTASELSDTAMYLT